MDFVWLLMKENESFKRWEAEISKVKHGLGILVSPAQYLQRYEQTGKVLQLLLQCPSTGRYSRNLPESPPDIILACPSPKIERPTAGALPNNMEFSKGEKQAQAIRCKILGLGSSGSFTPLSSNVNHATGRPSGCLDTYIWMHEFLLLRRTACGGQSPKKKPT